MSWFVRGQNYFLGEGSFGKVIIWLDQDKRVAVKEHGPDTTDKQAIQEYDLLRQCCKIDPNLFVNALWIRKLGKLWKMAMELGRQTWGE